MKIITLSTVREVLTKALVVAIGVDYRKLEAIGTDRYSGVGVYYGAAKTEALAPKKKLFKM